MKFNKIMTLCFTLLLCTSLLAGCSSGPSEGEKALYNEQAEVFNKKLFF